MLVSETPVLGGTILAGFMRSTCHLGCLPGPDRSLNGPCPECRHSVSLIPEELVGLYVSGKMVFDRFARVAQPARIRQAAFTSELLVRIQPLAFESREPRGRHAIISSIREQGLLLQLFWVP